MKSVDGNALIIDPFDGVRVSTMSGEDVPVPTAKGRALLGYLAMRRYHLEQRQRITGMLWSEAPEAKARAALRQCVQKLRRALQPDFDDALAVRRADIGLNKDRIEARPDKLIADVQSGQVDPFLKDRASLPENLFYGLDDLDPAFTTWIYVTRQAWRQRITAALEDALAKSDDPAHAFDLAEAITTNDPSHEPAHCILIRHHAEIGNVAAAIRVYDRLWQELDENHDTEPSPETIALISDIKMGRIGRQVAALSTGKIKPATAVQMDHAPRVLVKKLPIPTLRTKETHIALGFRSELVGALSRFREWIVIDANASMRDAPFEYAIALSVLAMSDGLRILVTLSDAETGQAIWSQNYDAEPVLFSDALRLIVRRIALALNVYLSAERAAAIGRDARHDWNTFDAWLQGQTLAFRWEANARDEAERILQHLIDTAPGFAPAYASLAMLENTRHLAFPGIFPEPKRLATALGYAQTAVARDPLDTKTHLAAAWSLAMNRRFNAAQQYFSQSYDLNPNDPWTIVSAGLGLAFCGALTDGMELAREALILDQHPSPSHCEYQSNIRFLAADYEASLKWSELAAGATGDSAGWRVASLTHLGREDEAKEIAKEFVSSVARTWHGQESPTARHVADWFLSLHPLANADDHARLREGLLGAGIFSTD